jgi:hypothetical protein
MLTNNVVSDGRRRLESSEDFEAARAQIVARIRSEFAPRIAAAGLIKRLWLNWRQERAIHRETSRSSVAGTAVAPDSWGRIKATLVHRSQRKRVRLVDE